MTQVVVAHVPMSKSMMRRTLKRYSIDRKELARRLTTNPGYATNCVTYIHLVNPNSGREYAHFGD